MRAHLVSFARASALALIVAAPATAQVVAITGGTVFPVSGPKIEHATVLIRDGKIVAVGAAVAIPDGAQRIDATGKWVTPGFINAATTLGISGISGVPETRDNVARSPNNVTAWFQPWEGLNAASQIIAPARNDGVTSAVIYPGGGMIAGQAAMIDLTGNAVDAMVRKGPAAMSVSIGHTFGARAEVLAKLREVLDDAKTYATKRPQYEAGNTRTYAASKADLEALQPVLAGKLPVVINANRRDDIESALKLAKAYKFKLIIAGGAEAWMVASELAAAKVPVLTGGMLNIPLSFSTLGQRQDNAALLRKAGVSVLLISDSYGDGFSFNVRNIRYEAGNAVSNGMSWDDALKAVTWSPAEAFGVSDKVGALAAGLDANVVVWSGDPFEFMTHAEAVFIKGKRVDAPSRQDELMKRYRRLPAEYRAP